jgi:hypothetical protein
MWSIQALFTSMVPVQAKEAEEIKTLRKEIDQYTRARPMPNLGTPNFEINWDLVAPATVPKPFNFHVCQRQHERHMASQIMSRTISS